MQSITYTKYVRYDSSGKPILVQKATKTLNPEKEEKGWKLFRYTKSEQRWKNGKLFAQAEDVIEVPPGMVPIIWRGGVVRGTNLNEWHYRIFFQPAEQLEWNKQWQQYLAEVRTRLQKFISDAGPYAAHSWIKPGVESLNRRIESTEKRLSEFPLQPAFKFARIFDDDIQELYRLLAKLKQRLKELNQAPPPETAPKPTVSSSILAKLRQVLNTLRTLRNELARYVNHSVFGARVQAMLRVMDAEIARLSPFE